MDTVIYPVLMFLGVLMGISFLVQKREKNTIRSQKHYFLANRSLSGVVLALTLVATYGSVSSFVSGPGIAWNLGLGWVVFAAPQIITGFLILGVIGKKMAVLSRRTGSLTVIDLMACRYRSRLLSILLSLTLIIFFTATIVAQFIGGAQIFAAITGLDYKLALLLFAVVTTVYTSGGFKTVALTDGICAVLMLTGMGALGYSILEQAGGLTSAMEYLSTLQQDENGVSALLTYDSHGALPLSLLFSAWILVGFATVGLPQSMVRCMSYRNTFDLHQAMIVASIVCGALMIGMTLLGVLSRAVLTQMPPNGTDSIIPTLIVTTMSPLMASVTILGPLAATMSTVSSLLIASTSAVMRDLYYAVKPQADRSDEMKKSYIPVALTLVLGGVSILLAMYPLDLVAWVNLFAFGGLETAFLWPMMLGLFWSKMNARGALWGMGAGLLCYVGFGIFSVNILGFHNIVWGLLVSLIASIIGSLRYCEYDRPMLEIFFPHKI